MHCTHSYTHPHKLVICINGSIYMKKSALKVARSLLSLYSWLVGCIKIVMRICRQANHHAVAYWRLLAVVVVLWDYEHCTVNAVSASASDCGLLMVKCPEASLSRCCCPRLQSGLRCRMQQRLELSMNFRELSCPSCPFSYSQYFIFARHTDCLSELMFL